MLKLDDNPVTRFPAGRPLAQDRGSWFVAHVKPRQEKALAKDLQKRGISYYLPLTEKRSRRRDNGKIRKSIVPLFPGYISFACPPEQKSRAFGTQRIVHVLDVVDQDRFVLECSRVEQALRNGVNVDLWANAEPGTPVRVVSGPLAGISGEMVEREGKTRLVIRVDILGQAIAVCVNHTDVEPL